MIAEKLKEDGVSAVPVYGGMEPYEASKKDLGWADQALTIEIMQQLPVPEYDTPLEALVTLRGNPAFRQALNDLLEWKHLQLPGIVLAEDRKAAIANAMRDFDRLTRQYAEAMQAQGFKKWIKVGSIFVSAVLGGIPGAVKEGLVAYKEIREPRWKTLAGMKCAPGGVVYHFREALE
jgi:hypothetical protein